VKAEEPLIGQGDGLGDLLGLGIRAGDVPKKMRACRSMRGRNDRKAACTASGAERTETGLFGVLIGMISWNGPSPGGDGLE
jgi:hypothetical protein